MIQLHRDYLLLQTPSGNFVPCTTELFSIQLIDSTGSVVDADMIRQAAAAVLHYFKHDLGRQSVSVAEFANALEHVLKAVGLTPTAAAAKGSDHLVVTDLHTLATGALGGFELAFFSSLRAELKNRLAASPQVLRFQGLRGCVKELLGAKRWSHRCQELNDQIVDYLRDCLETEAPAASCGLVVS
ncbi:MAG: hypothetical protein HY735_28850 [Verrucomicrobia bacterium]|nr:hypothetical protein [Verrucomicrobiota bacterium]